jgi:hypothetical protein
MSRSRDRLAARPETEKKPNLSAGLGKDQFRAARFLSRHRPRPVIA